MEGVFGSWACGASAWEMVGRVRRENKLARHLPREGDARLLQHVALLQRDLAHARGLVLLLLMMMMMMMMMMMQKTNCLGSTRRYHKHDLSRPY